jgi:NADH-quinone oxidoreductase subunit G
MATIEIDGKTFDVENGKMIIEVADEAGIHIPRFCYHKKLSVAANCRMCLVGIENSRKTVPACATPITDGMKVFTKSAEALRSQKAVMDFLLINHPLDCPICDQGGECELQDVSMGYGRDETTYLDAKRAADDDNLGSLISTEMTRCIHCTRCVRFGDEIAGLRELGGMGRGESMQIGTYVQHSLVSEISGNIIDLCPVGALTSKPYRFTARAWEMSQHDGVAPHDCLGSNVHVHIRRNRLMRVVPKEKETINETWLSDRDRFSYVGLQSDDRAGQPLIKQEGQWKVVDWETALTFAAKGMARVIKEQGPEQFAAIASPSSSVEEFYLLQRLMRHMGVQNLDHRLQQTDFRDDALQPMMPTSTLTYADLDHQDVIVLLGCQLVREVPLAGVRVRKAHQNGAKIYAMGSVCDEMHVPVTETLLVSPQDFSMQLACLVRALLDDETPVPDSLQALLIGLVPDEKIEILATALQQPKAVFITGALFENHPDAALLRTLVSWISQLSGARHVRLTAGANSAGAWVAGMLPHRAEAGSSLETVGLNTQASLDAMLKGYLLMGVEPEFDFSNPYHARQSMLAAEFVVVLTGFEHEAIKEYADVILPMGLYAETSGTYINLDHTWQTVAGALPPPHQARPAWKILRVLGNLLQTPAFDYSSTDDVLKEVQSKIDRSQLREHDLFYPESLPLTQHELVRVGEWPLYRSDAIVRRAQPLQACAAADVSCIRIHPKTAEKLHLGNTATVSQGHIEITLPLKRDVRIAPDVVWVANAMPETVDLGHAFAAITIKPSL